MSGILNEIALYLENNARLQKGEFQLGTLDLESLTEIAPLNQKFEALVLGCRACGKATAFLALKSMDQFLDLQKKSIVQCRHCHTEIQIPKTQKIREIQGKIYNFLQFQDWIVTRILIGKGTLLHFSVSEGSVTFQLSDQPDQKPIDIEIPPNKRKLLRDLQQGHRYRLKAKVYIATMLDLRKTFLKQSHQKPESEQIQRYELLSLTKIKS